MKTYQIKTYNIDWTYKDTINPNEILNDISFSANINWWVWQLSIKTTYPFSENRYNWWEYVKVVLFDDYHKDWLQIYYWYISQIIREIQSSREYTTLICLWINSLLNDVLFTNWTYSKTPSDMISDVLTYFQTYYNCITAWTIDDSIATTQWYNRQYKNCQEIFTSVCEWNGLNFFVDWEWKLQVFTEWKTHFLHLHYDIDSMKIEDTIEDIVNSYSVARSWWTVKTYTDEDSIATYWIKRKYESNDKLNNVSTQDIYWNQYIADHKNPKEVMSITLNTNIAYEDIKPWDKITVLNAWIEITNKTVNKIQYKPDECVLTIDKTDTLRWVIS